MDESIRKLRRAQDDYALAINAQYEAAKRIISWEENKMISQLHWPWFLAIVLIVPMVFGLILDAIFHWIGFESIRPVLFQVLFVIVILLYLALILYARKEMRKDYDDIIESAVNNYERQEHHMNELRAGIVLDPYFLEHPSLSNQVFILLTPQASVLGDYYVSRIHDIDIDAFVEYILAYETPKLLDGNSDDDDLGTRYHKAYVDYYHKMATIRDAGKNRPYWHDVKKWMHAKW